MKSTTPLSGLVMIALSMGQMAPSAFAAEDVSFVLEPHCSATTRTECPVFSVADAEHLTTSELKIGDLVDLDVVLTRGAGRDIETVRSWLKYDPQILEARSVELTSTIAGPIPDEQSIDAASGFVKIGGNVGTVTENRVAIARVTFRVLSAAANTDIAFHDYRSDGTGHTSINSIIESEPDDNSDEKLALPCIGKLVGCEKSTFTLPLLIGEPTTLTVLLQGEHPAATDNAEAAAVPSSSSSTQMNSSAAWKDNVTLDAIQQWQSTGSGIGAMSSSASPSGASSFTLLQVQNVRITSKDDSVFLGWLPLKSSELAGYNVYYGTVSGKYIQRRSIPANATSLVIRDLLEDTTQYLAVRGYNAANQETVFSQEVSVVVGQPETSSAPLIGTIADSEAPRGNPIETRGGTQMSGETGMSSTMLVLALVSGMIGTAFAAHRQYTFLSAIPC